MVDPLSLEAITTAVTAAAGSVGTEAGRQAWGSLADLARRAFGRGREEDGAAAAALPLDPDSGQQNQALAALLFGRAFQDAAFAAEYRRWEESARAVHTTVDNSTVVNNVSGEARVRTLYQGRDITVHPQ
ncbi:hypothetical protein [Streptomyces griseocarneus]|uniref:hypothetical protein n=1 Tax=Streptomyces griseocarneus TaxID=51201 RepID=UPI00167D2334|nr:hypothetical protein [Streptomyces griseocarneus]MBZ6474820.1 hypothetical protein [Streptomyces griseocarneus]GHG48283.1 hypothetical protein GCM10018779_06390 [Streptomyces griseocarneus]